MPRAFAIVLIIFNVIAVIGGGASGRLLIRGSGETFTAAEFEQRLASRLAGATTPDDLRRTSEEVAHLAASAQSLLQQSVQLTERAFNFIVVLAALNLLCVGAGLWSARSAARRNI